jgi:hypothetical protein
LRERTNESFAQMMLLLQWKPAVRSAPSMVGHSCADMAM